MPQLHHLKCRDHDDKGTYLTKLLCELIQLIYGQHLELYLEHVNIQEALALIICPKTKIESIGTSGKENSGKQQAYGEDIWEVGWLLLKLLHGTAWSFCMESQLACGAGPPVAARLTKTGLKSLQMVSRACP